VPSESQSWPKSSCAVRVNGWPKSDWYYSKLRATSLTPMIVHVRFMHRADMCIRRSSIRTDATQKLKRHKKHKKRRTDFFALFVAAMLLCSVPFH
jgi:hypothetical protein